MIAPASDPAQSHTLYSPLPQILLLLLLLLCLPYVHAQETYDRTFVVQETSDSPDMNLADDVPDASLDPGQQVTLRAALMQASTLGGRTLITFGRTMTITNLNGQQWVNANVTIRGLGTNQTIIDADQRGRAFSIGSLADRNAYQVRLENLTLRNGYVVADATAVVANAGIANYWSELTLTNAVLANNVAAGDPRYASHGAIGSTGTGLTLDHCVFVNNQAVSEGGAVGCSHADSVTIRHCIFQGNRAAQGGALHTRVGTTTIENSLFYDNLSTGDGAAIFNRSLLMMDNSTLSRNSAGNRGGAIFEEYGGGTLRHVTLAFNEAQQGGGIYHASGSPYPPVNLENCLLAFNTPNSGAGFISRIIDIRGNVATDATCNTPEQRRGDPLLGPLANHGGNTLTHPIFAGSIALDVPDAGDVLTTDQRGSSRPQDGDGDTVAAPDAGAFEAVGIPPSPTVDLLIDSPLLDFGDVAVGSSNETGITLHNVGPLRATISAITLSPTASFTLNLNAGATPIQNLPAQIPVGQSRTFAVSFQPSSADTWQTELSVSSDDTDAPLQILAFSGIGRLGQPDLKVIPPALDFGTVPLGQSSDLSLTLTNAGDGLLEFGTLTWAAGSDTAFSLPADPISSTTLVSGSEATLDIRCSPTLEGNLNATLQIPSTDPDESPLLVHVVAQTGSSPLVAGTTALTLDGGLGNDAIYGVSVDSQGKLLGAGTFAVDVNDTTGFLVKRGSSWTNTMELGPVGNGKDDSNDQFLDVAVDSSDNIIAVGVQSGSYNADGYHQAVVVRKYTPGGEQLWSRTHTDFAWNAGRAVAVDQADNIYVAGNVYTSFTVNNQWVILKYNPAGDLQTGFPIKVNFSNLSSPYDLAYGIDVTPDGRFVVVGQRAVAADNVDWHVRCYEANGTLAWEDTFAGTAGRYDVASAVAIDPAGRVVVVGHTNQGADNGNQADYDWLIIQYGPEGERNWTATYESAPGRSETAAAVVIDDLDQVVVGGNYRDDSRTEQWRVAQHAAEDGSLLLEQLWGSDSRQVLQDLDLRDGHVIIGGARFGTDSNDGYWEAGLYLDQPALTFTPDSISFDLVLVGETATRTLTVRNGSDQEITFAAPAHDDSPSEPFLVTDDSVSGTTLAAGATAEIRITFRPTVSNTYTDALVLRELGGEGDTWSIPVSGTAVDPSPLGHETFVHTEDGGHGHDYGQSVAWRSDAHLVAVGYLTASTDPPFGTTGIVRQFGETTWSDDLEMGQVVGIKQESNDAFHDVAVDSLNNTIVAGVQSGSYSADGYHLAMVTRKYDSSGALTWTRLYHNHAWNAARGIALDAQDNIYVTGNAFTSWGTYNQWAILKYSPSGELQPGYPVFYDQGLQDSPIDIPHDIATSPDGDWVVVGQVVGGTDNLDWHVRHHGSDGVLAGSDSFAGSSGLHDIANCVALDPHGDFVVGGYSNQGTDNGAAANYDWLVIKYDRTNLERLWTFTFESAPGRSEACLTLTVDGLGRVLAGGYIRDETDALQGCLLQLSADSGTILARQDWPPSEFAILRGIALNDHELALTGYAELDSQRDAHTVVQSIPLPRIHTWTVGPDTVTLGWNYQMKPASVQHSPTLTNPDWSPLAEDLTEGIWTGSLPESPGGFLRIVEP